MGLFLFSLRIIFNSLYGNGAVKYKGGICYEILWKEI